MRLNHKMHKRRGAVIPLIAICLVAILGMVALAIDIGMVAVAKTQAQNAADTAAMVGARSFNQQTGYNLTNVPKQSVTAAVANKIFAVNINGDPNSIANPTGDVYTSGDVKLEFGGYYYVYNDSNPAAEKFEIVVPGKVSTEPYTAVRSTITSTSPVFFGGVFGASPFNIKAQAVAAHRPRDVVIIMDLSGSMRFQSCPGGYLSGSNIYPNWGPRNKSLNPDTIYPKFGHYSDTGAAALYGNTSYSTGVEMVDPANHTVASNSGPCFIADWMSSGSTPAFVRDSSKDGYDIAPGGDNYLKSSGTYVKTVTEYLGASATNTQLTNWARNGYGTPFNGYTEGPGYWGKTFFIWPPDPRGSDLDANVAANHANNGAKDWRQRFFFKKNTATNQLYWLDQNTLLFNNSGSTGPGTVDNSGVTPIMRRPTQTRNVTESGASVTYRYCINYAAIFHWLRNETPTHFPASMTTGRINFYSNIPDPTGDNSFNNRFWTQSPMTNLNERFWKDYVDFMLGLDESGVDSYNNTYNNNPISSYIGSGDFYPWGTVQISNTPDCSYKATVNSSGGYAIGHTGTVSFNNVKKLDGTSIDLPGPNPITAATAATPVVITSTAHGLTTGNKVTIQGVGGTIGGVINNDSASTAQKMWTITRIDNDKFSLDTSVGVGLAYTAGTGSWIPAITAATNASPIVITTGAPHNIPNDGNTYTINLTGIEGNTAANQKVAVTYVNSTQFSLKNSTGSGTYANLLGTQWWEPVYFVRFGYASTFHELNPATVTTGILTATPDIALTVAPANGSAVKIYTQPPKYMDHADNPYRPRHQMWFGPATFTDWLGNYEMNNLRWPGNVHEAQAWACKVGISSGIDDIKNNHPNDYVGMTFFSSPSYSTSGGGQHNMAVVPLGREYQKLKDSLWFPPSTVAGAATVITPYDADFNNVPRAKGGTCPNMGFMIAFNLFSSSTTNLRSFATPTTTYRGYAGGLGRKGAERLVIFETDGAPNTSATATIQGTGSDVYYKVRIKNPASISDGSNEFPSSPGYTDSQVYDTVKQICAQTTAAPAGYSTTRKPAKVFSLGYGSLFDPGNTSNVAAQNDALDFLQTVQYYGNVSTSMSGGTFPDWQRIYGTNQQREDRMKAAFTTIMQTGVQVSLIE